MKQLGELHSHRQEFEALGAELWAISPDPIDKLEKWAAKNAEGMVLLSDRGLETIRAYGVLNEKSGSVPHPTAIVIDKTGAVRWIRIDRDYTKRPSVEALLEQVRALASAD